MTTTTTTTTTTVRKGGRGRSQQREHQETKAHVETQPGASASGTSSAIPPAEGGGGIVEAPGDNSPRQPAAPRPTRDRSHSPAVPPPRIQTQTPPPPEQFRPRSPSPAPPQQQYPDAIVTDSTPLPPRSPHRRPADVPSPVRPNFSHPSRGHLRGAGTVQGENVNGYEERHYPPPSSAQRQEQALNSPALSHRSGFVGPGGREGVDENEPRSSTTFENLKTAAIGLHVRPSTSACNLGSVASICLTCPSAEIFRVSFGIRRMLTTSSYRRASEKPCEVLSTAQPTPGSPAAMPRRTLTPKQRTARRWSAGSGRWLG